MTDYTAPLRDITFSMFEVFDYQHHYETRFQGADVNPELIGVILEEFGRFCSEQLSPLNAVGDREGCTWNGGEVTTPTGFKEAYQQYVAGGWPALAGDPQYGGQGLPE